MTWEKQDNTHPSLPVPTHRGNFPAYSQTCHGLNFLQQRGINVASPLTGLFRTWSSRCVRGCVPCTELCRKVFRGQKKEGQEAGPKNLTPNPLCFGTSRNSPSPSRPSKRSGISPDALAARSNTGCLASISRRRTCSRSCSPKSCVDSRPVEGGEYPSRATRSSVVPRKVTCGPAGL